jgi:serine/threonine-protein kinase
LDALKLDDNLAEAHTSLAMIKANYDWDFSGAVREFEKAIELKPGYATAHQWLGLHFAFNGRFEEAMRELKLAQKLDPLSAVISTGLGVIFYFAGRYDEALEELKKGVELSPGLSQTHLFLGLAYLRKGAVDEAAAAIDRAHSIGLDHMTSAVSAIVQSELGREDKREEVLEQFVAESEKRYISPVPIAWLLFSLGRKDEGLDWLDKAFEIRDHQLWGLNVWPWFESVRDHPRFKEMVKKRGSDS